MKLSTQERGPPDLLFTLLSRPALPAPSDKTAHRRALGTWAVVG
ncbi:hypothetical protein ACFWNT_34870 [Streptomyces sp. NPDC058409]